MTDGRTVEDRLRAEYFQLLPDMQRTLVALDSEVRHHLLPIIIGLDRYEQVRIVSRLKECESAVDKLRRKQEPRGFDPAKFDAYTLSALPDLVGIRILVFPSNRLDEVRSALLALLSNWSLSPFDAIGDAEIPGGLKYFGRCAPARTDILAEIQIVSSLIGSFWEVEHSALYKTNPELQGVRASLSMRERYNDVYKALRAFENEFERLVRERGTNS
jgi:ppGpp synthetase/RelA/SpoT-type nucleotidyltranferase